MTEGQLGMLRERALALMVNGLTFDEVLACLRVENYRKVFFCGVFIGPLIKAWKFCQANKTTMIKMSKIGLTPIEYSRFNDLVRFNFMTSTEERGVYIMDLQLISDFFNRRRDIPAYFLRDPKVPKRVILAQEKIFIYDVPRTDKIIQDYGEKFTEYVRPLRTSAQGSLFDTDVEPG